MRILTHTVLPEEEGRMVKGILRGSLQDVYKRQVFGLNHSFADILTGIILFFIIGSEFFITYKINLRKSAEKEA